MNETRKKKRQITPVYRVIKRGEEDKTDLEYWLSRPIQERLAAQEEIRREYNSWRYGTKQRFQRVYRVIKRT
ncbi:toxin secretion, membrane fusion protein [Sphingobacteriales bacterium CHB3]|nr:toxin secretion, membrane fusion protein [Sphingobacteriales bacterium CHB3]